MESPEHKIKLGDKNEFNIEEWTSKYLYNSMNF